VPDLGSFADEDALQTKLDAVPDVTRLTPSAGSSTRSSTAVEQEGRIDRCDQTVQAQGDLSTRLAIATAEVDGVRVLVFSHPVEGDAGEEPRTQLTVVDAADCRVLFAVQR
jgi:hypothetical protein